MSLKNQRRRQTKERYICVSVAWVNKRLVPINYFVSKQSEQNYKIENSYMHAAGRQEKRWVGRQTGRGRFLNELRCYREYQRMGRFGQKI